MLVSEEPRIWVAGLIVLGVYLSIEAAEDFARGKPASMSSAFNSSYTAGNAVDGDKDTYIFTELNQNYAWWRVDLQQEVTSPKIKLYFRPKAGLPNTLYEVQFYTSKEYFPSPDSAVWSPPSGVKNLWSWRVDNNYISFGPVEFEMELRYLLIYTTGNNSGRGAFLDFKEVEAWACPEGFYGDDCSEACSSRGCRGTSICPYADGACKKGCGSNYRLKNCSACKTDLFGEQCNLQCSGRGCEGNSSCPRNGTCDNGCASGYTGTSCSDCTGDNSVCTSSACPLEMVWLTFVFFLFWAFMTRC